MMRLQRPKHRKVQTKLKSKKKKKRGKEKGDTCLLLSYIYIGNKNMSENHKEYGVQKFLAIYSTTCWHIRGGGAKGRLQTTEHHKIQTKSPAKVKSKKKIKRGKEIYVCS